MNKIKEIREGNYSLKVIPTDSKSWNEADTETKTFKGLIDLFGIIREVVI